MRVWGGGGGVAHGGAAHGSSPRQLALAPQQLRPHALRASPPPHTPTHSLTQRAVHWAWSRHCHCHCQQLQEEKCHPQHHSLTHSLRHSLTASLTACRGSFHATLSLLHCCFWSSGVETLLLCDKCQLPEVKVSE